MSRRENRRRQDLRVESLEGRALLSGLGIDRPHGAEAAILARLHGPRFSINSAGKSAVINALLGGAGHEFVALGLKEVKNPLGVAAGFSSGTLTQYNVPGIAVKQINLQSGYTGLPHDVLALNIGGAVVLKHKKIELGAIVRGPFTTTPFATDIVFAINRGAGARLGPYYASRPGITPDALVTVAVGPNGQGNSATYHRPDDRDDATDQLAGDLGVRADGADPAEHQPAPVGGVRAEALHVRGLDRDPAECPDPGRGQLRAGGFDDPDRHRDEREAHPLIGEDD